MAGKVASLLLLAVVVVSVALASLPTSEATVQPTAIYVFGDSTADVGNNNYLPGGFQSKANYPHNGIDYPGGRPTGRFSNGYNSVDFLAKMMSFQKSPPAALSIKKATKAQKGVNFASGSSGILDITGENVSLSMNKQIELFKVRVHDLKKAKGNKATRHFLSKSIFFFSTGNNDIFNYFLKFGPQNLTREEQIISLLALNFKDQLQELYKLGARKFALTGTSHLGCIPFIRKSTPTGDCIEDLNTLSQLYNKAISGVLQDLSSKLKGMKYSFTNPYNLFPTTTAGTVYKEIRSACCGNGRLNAETPCIPNSTYCSNRNEYLFWDAYHPTEITYKMTAELAYGGPPLFVTPMNIKQLLELIC